MNNQGTYIVNTSTRRNIGGEIRIAHKLIANVKLGRDIAGHCKDFGFAGCFLFFSGEVYFISHGKGFQVGLGFWIDNILDDRD